MLKNRICLAANLADKNKLASTRREKGGKNKGFSCDKLNVSSSHLLTRGAAARGNFGEGKRCNRKSQRECTDDMTQNIRPIWKGKKQRVQVL